MHFGNNVVSVEICEVLVGRLKATNTWFGTAQSPMTLTSSDHGVKNHLNSIRWDIFRYGN